MNSTLKREQQKHEKLNLNIAAMPITTKFLHGIVGMNGPLWAVLRIPQQIQDGGRRPY